MAGLLKDQMEGAADERAEATAPKTEAGEKAQKGAAKLAVSAVREKIQVPPELKEAYQKIIAAGLKVMYSEETHQDVMNMLPKDGTPGENLGRGIANLMSLLFQQSNQTMPPQLLIPCGLYLLVDAAEFMQQSGDSDLTDEDVGDAVLAMITEIFKMAGASADQAMQLMDQMGMSEQAGNPEGPRDAGDAAGTPDEAQAPAPVPEEGPRGAADDDAAAEEEPVDDNRFPEED
jgi:hypothetical protein